LIDERGTFVGRSRHIAFNWGASSWPDRIKSCGRIFNEPSQVAIAGNKLLTFGVIKDNPNIRNPEFTTDKEVAKQWTEEGKVVVARTKLNGHSGAGIVVAARSEDVPDAPLYTLYIKKTKEFRVHVAFNEVIDVQAKRKRQEVPNDQVDYAIRNHHTGWVYCRENIEEPEELRAMALETVKAMGLDFGAVDIIYNQHYNQCYVLEVNTAPGLEGTSVEVYKQAFLKEISKYE
jgi:glutathione synthase/RimK-type ligase-like ATP-grasp enzyme